MKNNNLILASKNPGMPFYKASCIDMVCRPLVINQTWMYKSDLDTSKIKEALQEILNTYPTLAGRMSANGILCNNSGVMWEEGRYPDIRITDIPRTEMPGKRFYAEFKQKDALKGNFPLMSVKVNHLKDGTILNVKCSHFCTDGDSFYTMMENWASLTRNGGLVRTPVYDDAAVKKVLTNSNMYKTMATSDMKAKEYLLQNEGMYRIKPAILLRMMWQKLMRIDKRLSAPIFVQYSKIDSIKEEASRISGNHIGRNAALCATTVEILKQRMHWSGTNISIVHTADHRERIRGIDINYTGNASFTLRPTTVSADLPSGKMAAFIDEDMKRMLEPEQEQNFFASYCTLLENKMPWLPFDINSMWCAHPSTFIVNNCLKFNIYRIDFGKGCPIFAWPLDFSDPVRFWPAPPEENGVYIYFTGNFARR